MKGIQDFFANYWWAIIIAVILIFCIGIGIARHKDGGGSGCECCGTPGCL